MIGMSNRKKHNCIKKSGNHGYTLVELIVVIAIIAILAGAAGWGVLGWIDWMNFKRQNEYAQTLYVAAQNQLSEYCENGQIDELTEKIDGAQLNLSNIKITDSTGAVVDKSAIQQAVWKESQNKLDGEKDVSNRYQGEVYSLMVTKADYEAYKNGDLKDSVKLALYQMLSSYVYKPSILDAAICVEFSPEAGQIYSVLYSDKKDAFTYDESNETKDMVSICDREKSYRKDRMVGYYGVDCLTEGTSVKALRPSIGHVRLNNEDTLNLSYKLTRLSEATQVMSYEITIKSAKDSSALMTLLLDGTQLKNKENAEAIYMKKTSEADETIPEYTTCDRNADGTAPEGSIPIWAWVEEDGTVRIVLDAADLSATSIAYYEAYEGLYNKETKDNDKLIKAQSFAKTMSFHRFGLDEDDIFCTVKGTGDLYKTASAKNSNEENAYFGSAKEKDDTTTYTISNCRHLYNIRYVEDYSSKQQETSYQKGLVSGASTFKIDAAMDWQNFIKNNSLYDNGVRKTNTQTAFPSIAQLRDGDKFTSTKQSKNIINHLILSETANIKAGLFYDEEEKEAQIRSTVTNGTDVSCPVGLFVMNKGEISQISLDNVTVNGRDYVGTICGISNSIGTISNVKVDSTKNESSVTGRSFVGGIFGTQVEASEDQIIKKYAQAIYASSEEEYVIEEAIHYESLTNAATIKGAQYVGGIAGKLDIASIHNKPSFVVDLPKEDEQEQNEKWYEKVWHFIHDIIWGSNVREKVIVQYRPIVTVSNCENYGLTLGNAVWKDSDEKELKNAYIGGITGYATGDESLTIEACNSCPHYTDKDVDIASLLANETKLNEMLKGTYVGGIVGYNVDAVIDNCNTKKEGRQEGYLFGDRFVGGIVGYNEGNTINGGNGTGSYGYNEINVIGNQYVGGITGCNAKITNADQLTGQTIENERAEDLVISNWINRGAVVAKNSYVGGITGYNTGKIADCNSSVSRTDTASNISKSESLQGSYAGGIAGYNNGAIYKGDVTSDAYLNAVVYISGKDYIGGIVGYNDVEATVRDYKVTGGYVIGTGCYIGGYAGFNASKDLLMEDKTNAARNIKCNPNEVSGKYFVGGVIGGNIVFTTENINTYFETNNFLGNVTATAVAGGYIGYNRLVGSDVKIAETAESLRNSMEATGNLESIPNCLKTTVDSQYKIGKLNVQGISNDTTQTKFGSVVADIYVAGVVGYNDENTPLYISGVVNKTLVTANAAIVNGNEQKSDTNTDGKHTYTDSPYTYSYAGGIIGKVNSKTIIDNCRNQDVGDVSTKGTYIGGIAEINEGTIKNCQGSSIGSGSHDYVGGIVGLNKAGAVVEACSVKDKTITGKNYVGGIVSENYGTVQDVDASNLEVSASGDYGLVGGIVGVNYSSGNVSLANKTIKIDVTSKGNHVGGIIGENQGTTAVTEDNADTTDLTIEGNVAGNRIVGGFVGCQKSSGTISNIYNKANVTAETGTAGGIVGESIQSTTILNCTNEGIVTAANMGNAGGIISDNYGTIKSCTDTGKVLAGKGNAGGICAVNAGEITSCRVKGKSESDRLEFAALESTGGICAINQNKIENSSSEYLTISSIATSKGENVAIGAICGMNEGENGSASATITGGTVEHCMIKGSLNKMNMGGITGKNQGTIDTITVDNGTDMRFTGAYANVGGASGSNTGTISNVTVISDITGTNGDDDYGYGGIAGVNQGVLSQCHYSGALKADGQANAVANIGGTSGKNLKDGTISSCSVGKDKSTVISSGNTNIESGFAYLGGMVGWNYGKIVSCDNESLKNASNKVEVIGYKGHTGGITGFEAAEAVITGEKGKPLTTGSNWTVTANSFSNDCGTGGIIGYNESGEDMQYVDNYAAVTAKSNDSAVAGGFIGRSQNKYVLTTKYSNCSNYGVITSSRAGGFVGRMKYKPITFENCTNYAKILGKEAMAGIVAGTYLLDTDSMIVFDNCKNFGEINCYANSGGSGAGIFGYAEASRISALFTDCANEGCINNQNNNYGGIFGTASDGSTTASFYQCRNYGNGLKTNFDGITGYESSGKVTMVECFNLSNQKTMLTDNNQVTLRNHYLDINYDSDKIEDAVGQGTQEEAIPLTNIVSTSGAVCTVGSTTQNNLMKSYYGASGEKNILNRSAWKRIYVDKGNEITIDFSAAPKTMDGFELLMAGSADMDNGVLRTYEYKTEVTYEDKQVVSKSGTEDCPYKTGTYSDKAFTDANVIHIACDSSKAVKTIKVHIKTIWSGTKDNYNSGTSTYVCLWGAWAYLDKMPDIQKNNASVMQATALKTLNWKQNKNASDTVWKITTENNADTFALENISPEPQTSFADNTEYLRNAEPEEKKDRQKVYESIEEGQSGNQLSSYYAALHKGVTPQAMPITKLTMEAGTIQCSWSIDVNDMAYNNSQLVYIVKDSSGNEIATNKDNPITLSYGISSYQMPMDSKWVGCNITFYVRACSSEYQESQYQPENYPGGDGYTKQDNTSPWSEKSTIGKETLATPQVHVELVDENNFMVVLDNPKDYVGKNVKITANVNGTNVYITRTEQQSENEGTLSNLFQMKDTNGNINVTAFAEDSAGNTNGKYAKSVTLTLQTAFYGTEKLNTVTYFDTTFNDFYGDVPENMYNMLTIKGADGNTELYLNTEFLTDTYKVGNYTIPVVVSSGNPHITQSSYPAVNLKLESLPEDMLTTSSKLTVRAYPWNSQSYVTYYGHTVVSGISLETLEGYLAAPSTLVDTKRGEKEYRNNPPAVFNESRQLNDGYVIRENVDGTYDIIYSSIIKYQSKYEKQLQQKVYTVTPSSLDSEGKVIYGEGAGNQEYSICPQVNIDERCDYDDTTYKFSWNTINNASYQLSLYGIVVENGVETEVLLDTKDGVTENTYTFVNTEGNWNYTKLRLDVVCKGTTAADGKTIIFPSQASRTFDIRERLSQIEKPTNILHKENGVTQKDTLIYDLTWNAVPTEQREYVDHYEVSIKGADGTVKSFTTTTATDGTTNSCLGALTDEERSADTITRTIDLNAYAGGETIEISVRAIAKDVSNYRDSKKGVVREFEMPTRLETPDVTKLTATTSYYEHNAETPDGTKSYMTLDEVKDSGLTLQMTAEQDVAQAYYEIAVAVYDHGENNKYDDEAKNAATQKDRLTSGNWDDGAMDDTLYTKEKPQKLDGNLLSASCIWKDYAEKYAGKWLKVAMRTVSDSRVSSVWSDEDPDAVNYQWIRIPRIQLATPAVNMGTSEMYYDADDADDSDDFEWTEDGTGSNKIYQKSNTYELVSQADGYVFTRVYMGQGNESYGMKYDVDWIYLIKNGDTKYDVFFDTTCSEAKTGKPVQGSKMLDEHNEVIKDANGEEQTYPGNEQNAASVYLGTIDVDKYVQIPSTNVMKYGTPESNITPVTYVKLISEGNDTSESTTYKLQYVMPDIDKINDDVAATGVFTSQVSVQAIVSQQNLRDYEPSKLNNWYRKGVDGNYQTTSEVKEIEPMASYALKDYEQNQKVGVGVDATNKQYLLKMKIPDVNGAGLVAQLYVNGSVYTICGYTMDNQQDMDVCIPLGENLSSTVYQNKSSIKIRYATIDPVGENKVPNGISQWSTEAVDGTDWITIPENLFTTDPQTVTSGKNDSEFSFDTLAEYVTAAVNTLQENVKKQYVTGISVMLNQGIRNVGNMP